MDKALIAHGLLDAIGFAEFAADPFLLPVKGHGAVEIAPGLANDAMVAERVRQATTVAQLTADPLLLTAPGPRPSRSACSERTSAPARAPRAGMRTPWLPSEAGRRARARRARQSRAG